MPEDSKTKKIFNCVSQCHLLVFRHIFKCFSVRASIIFQACGFFFKVSFRSIFLVEKDSNSAHHDKNGF